MKHITKVRELYEETIQWISESDASWKEFLVCMGRLYQLDFLNACMVYAQRPDASVLAAGESLFFLLSYSGRALPMFMI